MAEQYDLSHGGDTCQGLTAKAERTNMFQVIDLGYFAGRVSCECQLEFICRDAGAVVGDTDKLQSTVRQIDANLSGPGIDAVFDEFLNHGCWALHDFTRGDFGSDLGRELTYWHAEILPRNYLRK
jgi:hypothetical protein